MKCFLYWFLLWFPLGWGFSCILLSSFLFQFQFYQIGFSLEFLNLIGLFAILDQKKSHKKVHWSDKTELQVKRARTKLTCSIAAARDLIFSSSWSQPERTWREMSSDLAKLERLTPESFTLKYVPVDYFCFNRISEFSSIHLHFPIRTRFAYAFEDKVI